MTSTPYAYSGATDRPRTGAKCAYVTLVWGGDGYTPGALVAAESLRRVGAQHDLVCMVTPDVPEASRERLRRVYDHVVAVEQIAQPSRKFAAKQQGELYNGWVDTSYTKWNALRLTEYSRVLVVDADVLFLVNCDELFELAPPAACFSMPWAEPHGTIGNHYLRGGRPPAHGETVAVETIREALSSDRASFVGCTWTTLLEPDMATFGRLMEVIRGEEIYADGCSCLNGPDEISLAETYATLGVSFRHISPRYAAIPWHQEWAGADCRALHYHGGTKPWETDRGKWPDLAAWWAAADSLESRLPGTMRRPTGCPEQLALTHRLRGILAGDPTPGREGAAAQREANNVLERWAIALANAGAGSYPFWPTALAGKGETANRQLLRELTDHRPTPARAGPADAVLEQALAAIRETGAADTAGPFEMRDGELVCAGAGAAVLARGVPASRLQLLLARGGLDAAARMALSYEVLAPGGCQWRIPSAHADHLYALGVRHEGFASPLNSNFIDRAGATYCSLFPEIDLPFGSSGSFFDADLSRGGGWLVNPPFIEGVLEKAAQKVVAALRAAGAPATPHLSVYFVVPAWRDSAAFRILSESEHLLASVDLVPGRYHYEEPSGKRVATRAASVYFALSTDRSAREATRAAIEHLAGGAAPPHLAGGAAPPHLAGGAAPPHLGRDPATERGRSVRPLQDDGSPGWDTPSTLRWPALVPPPRAGGARASGRPRPRETLWPKRDGHAS